MSSQSDPNRDVVPADPPDTRALVFAAVIGVTTLVALVLLLVAVG
jgi:hypothetical protein